LQTGDDVCIADNMLGIFKNNGIEYTKRDIVKEVFIHFIILNKQVERKFLDAQQKREYMKISASQEENIEEIKNNEIRYKIFILKNLNILIKNYCKKVY